MSWHSSGVVSISTADRTCIAMEIKRIVIVGLILSSCCCCRPACRAQPGCSPGLDTRQCGPRLHRSSRPLKLMTNISPPKYNHTAWHCKKILRWGLRRLVQWLMAPAWNWRPWSWCRCSRRRSSRRGRSSPCKGQAAHKRRQLRWKRGRGTLPCHPTIGRDPEIQDWSLRLKGLDIWNMLLDGVEEFGIFSWIV